MGVLCQPLFPQRTDRPKISAAAARSIAGLPGGWGDPYPVPRVNVNDFSDLVSFAVSTPLSQDDRDRISAAAREQLRRDPEDVQILHSCVRLLLGIANGKPRFERADFRERLRSAFETQPESDLSREIVDRIDPVVVVDSVHKRTITEATLTAWERAVRWATGLLSVPPPKNDFIADERAYLKENFAALPAERADAIFHVERNREAMERLLNEARPDRRAQYLRTSRRLAQDAEAFPMRLADAMEQAYEIALKRREGDPCLDRWQLGAVSLTPDLLASCDP